MNWRLIAREENRVLLIAEKGIDCKPYHEEEVGIMRGLLRSVFGKRHHDERAEVTWEKCSLRTWLNTSFLGTCFSADEQSRILTVAVANNAGNDTQDKIFLLSVDEAWRFFCNDYDRRCMVTAYAKNKGAFVYPDNAMFGVWWLRSRGRDDYYAACVNHDGLIGVDGLSVNCAYATVRPALWLDSTILES